MLQLIKYTCWPNKCMCKRNPTINH